MPFKSEKQKKWMASEEPEMFKEWINKYGSKAEDKDDNKKRKRADIHKSVMQSIGEDLGKKAESGKPFAAKITIIHKGKK